MDECIELLRGKTDEHKFAGLLMLSKLLKQPRYQEEWTKTRPQVYEALSCQFLQRLIRTAATMPQDLSVYQILGINIMSSFCDAQEFALDFIDSRTIDSIIAIFQSGIKQSQLQIVMDSICVVRGLCKVQEGMKILLEKGICKVFCDAIPALSFPEQDQKVEVNSENAAVSELDKSVAGDIMQLLQQVYRSCLQTEAQSVDTLQGLCKLLQATKTELRFCILSTLFSIFPQESPGLFSLEARLDLRRAVFEMLSDRSLPEKQRDETIHLLYMGLTSFEPSWACYESESDDKVFASGKFISLFVRLVSIESKFLLEDAETILVRMDPEEKIVEEDVEVEQNRKIERVMNMLPVCYSIIETCIVNLCRQEQWAQLPAQALEQLQSSFAQFIQVVLEFLVLSKDYMDTHIFKTYVDRKYTSSLHSLVYASIRVLGAWFAEETEIKDPALVQVLPFLINYQLPQVAETIEEELYDVDSDDELENEKHEESVSTDALLFLLPGLSQFTATEDGLDLLQDHQAVQERIITFCIRCCQQIAGVNSQPCDLVSILTLGLGTLINLVFMRRRMVPQFLKSMAWRRCVKAFMGLSSVVLNQLVQQQKAHQAGVEDSDLFLLLENVVCLILSILTHCTDDDVDHEMNLQGHREVKQQFLKAVKFVISCSPDEESGSCYDLRELTVGLFAEAKFSCAFLQSP